MTSDYAELMLLPRLRHHLGKHAPGVRLQVLPWGPHRAYVRLGHVMGTQSAQADEATGGAPNPGLTSGIDRALAALAPAARD